MITLINRLLQTEKRRICILFCTGCFCAAVFAFANARMWYLLVQLRSIEDVLALIQIPLALYRDFLAPENVKS